VILWARFWGSKTGNISVLFALGFSLFAMIGAIAIDAAAVYHERRALQSAVDLAALSAALDPNNAQALAEDSLKKAGLWRPGAASRLQVVAGTYQRDSTLAPDARFKPSVNGRNAVKVSFSETGSLYFARGWADPPELHASAIASLTPEVAFTAGSRLASLKGGIGNLVLNKLLGSDVALTLVDYNAVIGAQVDALDFLKALATRLSLTGASYNDLLAMSVHHGQIAGALADVLTGTQKTAMNKLASHAGHNGTVALGKLFSLGQLGPQPIGSGTGSFAKINVGELLMASAVLGGGERFVSLPAIVNLPAISIGAELTIGEPPQGGHWFKLDQENSVVRTAQVRLRFVASFLGSGALVGVPIRLPLYLQVAHGEAQVRKITCPTSAAPKGSVNIDAKPGVLRVMIGEITSATMRNFGADPLPGEAQLLEVSVLGIPVLRVLASALVQISQTVPISLGFTSGDIASGTVRTARTSTMVTSLTASLVQHMHLNVPLLGLGLNLTSLTALLGTIIVPLGPTIDGALNDVLSHLGLGLGELDVRVYAVRCVAPALVG
jgi:uncharacterized membrane protein